MKIKKRMKIILIVILSLCTIVAFLLSPVFNLKTINVTGAEFYTQEEIKESADSLKNQNYFIALFQNTPFSHLDYLFKGRLYATEQQLLFDKPYLKSVKVSFASPGAAEIEVTERIPAFFVKSGDEYLLVDSEGFVLEAIPPEEKKAYPVVEGIETADYKVGNTLAGGGTDLQLALAIKICNGMNQTQLSDGIVDIVDVSDTEQVWMFVKPSLSICFGDDQDLSIKLSVLKEILASGYDGNSDGVIDFTNGKNPIFKKNSEVEEPNDNLEANEEDALIDISIATENQEEE